MTIQELMKRVAGDDYTWEHLDGRMLHEMAEDEVAMAVMTGTGKDGRPFLFRLPVECLVKKE